VGTEPDDRPTGVEPNEEVGPAHPVVSRRTLAEHGGAVLVYFLVSLVLWWQVWITGHPSTSITCGCGDPVQEVWWLEWLPWAILHGHNPLLTNAIFAKQGGVNAFANTSWLLPGAVLSPITLAFGPVASFNVGNLLAPVASAWAMYLASGKLTRLAPARFLAGAAFGFCPFIFTNVVYGHINLTLDVFPPLAFVVIMKLVTERTVPPVRLGAWLGLATAAQFFIGVEVLAITAFVAVFAMVVAVLQAPRRAWALRRRVAVGSATAVAVGIVLLAYPLWFFFEGPRHVVGPFYPASAGLGLPLSAIVSPGPAHAASETTRLVGYFGARGPWAGYLGVALVAFLAASAWVWRHRRVCMVVAASGLFAWACSLGVRISGKFPAGTPFAPTSTTAWGPWAIFRHVPILSYIVPERFSIIVALAVAFLLAASIDGWSAKILERVLRTGPAEDRRRPTHPTRPTAATRRAGTVVTSLVVVVACLVLLPVALTYSAPFTTHPAAVPGWFHKQAPRLPPGTTVLAMPYPEGTYSDAMFWQAIDHMHFTLIGGWAYVPGHDGLHVQEISPPTGGVAVLESLSTGFGPLATFSPRSVAALRASVSRWLPLEVAVARYAPGSGTGVAAYFTAALGQEPRYEGGVWLWDLHSLAPPLDVTNSNLDECVLRYADAKNPLAVPNCVELEATPPS
jgi:hypothetical protein